MVSSVRQCKLRTGCSPGMDDAYLPVRKLPIYLCSSQPNGVFINALLTGSFTGAAFSALCSIICLGTEDCVNRLICFKACYPDLSRIFRKYYYLQADPRKGYTLRDRRFTQVGAGRRLYFDTGSGKITCPAAGNNGQREQADPWYGRDPFWHAFLPCFDPQTIHFLYIHAFPENQLPFVILCSRRPGGGQEL